MTPAPFKERRAMMIVESGPHTGGGAGDIYLDEHGDRWLVVPDHVSDGTPAAMTRSLVNGWIK